MGPLPPCCDIKSRTVEPTADSWPLGGLGLPVPFLGTTKQVLQSRHLPPSHPQPLLLLMLHRPL